MQQNQDKLNSHIFWIYLIAIIAFTLRTIHFAGTSSLWYDELTSALNVTEKSYYQLLTQPLDFNQVASIGFLLITKFFVTVFGQHDFSFRLLPWLCAVVSIYFFYQIARFFLKDTALLTVFILFAFATSGWFYAGQAKQYACDIAASLFLVWSCIKLYDSKLALAKIILLCVAGLIFITISMPAVPLASGLIFLLLIQYVIKGNPNSFRTLFIIGFTWALACAWVTYHAKFILSATSVDAMSTYWSRGFVPLTGLTDAIIWLAKNIRDELGYFLYLFLNDIWPAMTIFVTVLFVLALAGIIKLFSASTTKGFILFSPFFLAIILSLLRILPYDSRVALYASWPLLIAAISGAEWLSSVSFKNFHPSIAKACIIIIAMPMPTIHLLEPNEWPPFHCQPAQPVLKELKKQLQSGDIIHVYYKARHAMKMYGHKEGLTNYKLSGNYENVAQYYAQLDSLKGNKRVWFFTSQWTPKHKYPDNIHYYLSNEIGKELQVINDPYGAYLEKECACTATLYDLTQSSKK